MSRSFLFLLAGSLCSLSLAPPTIFGDEPPKQVAVEGKVGPFWIGVTSDPVEAGEGGGRLRVDSVFSGSPTEKAGIQPGDLLLSVGGKPLQNHGDLVDAITKSEGKTIKLELMRGGRKQTVELQPLRIPQNPLSLPEVLTLQKRRAEEQQRHAEEQLREALERLAIMLQQPMRDTPKQPEKLQEKKPSPPVVALAVQGGLPAEMEVTIQKRGKSPARITVKQGHREWRTVEGDLEMLPPDARAYVARALGLGAAQPTLQFQAPIQMKKWDLHRHGAEAIELELKLGPGGVVESVEAGDAKRLHLQEKTIRDGARVFWGELRQRDLAPASDDAEKETELERLREEIRKLHRELEVARKAWNEKLQEMLPKRQNP